MPPSSSTNYSKIMKGTLFMSTVTLLLTLFSFLGVDAKSSFNHTTPVEARGPSTCADPNEAFVWVRAWNAVSKSYSFTNTSALLIATTGDPAFRYLGEAAYVFPTQLEGTMPIYRYYNPTIQALKFIMSTNDAAPAAPPGYTLQGLKAYVYPTQRCCSVPLYEIFSSSLGDNFYTTDIIERDTLIASGLYVDQGIACYVLPVQKGPGSCTA